MAYTLPINNSIKVPSTSSQYANGNLPANVLQQVQFVETTCLCEPTAARAFTACFAAAKKALPSLRIKDVGDYRSVQAQITLFVDKGPNTDGRYKPVSQAEYNNTPAAHRKIWSIASKYGYNSIYWIKNYAKFGYWPATAATPESSNHGRGLAIDVAEEYDNDSAADPISVAFVTWLCNNAPRFGIFASLTSEPWHWQYVTGDSIPQAVLDYESPQGGADVQLIPREERIFDSRIRTAYSGSPLVPFQKAPITIPNAGGAKAATINLTVTESKGPGGWIATKDGTSKINWDRAGQTIANEVLVYLTPAGQFTVHCGPAGTHFIVDLVGLWK